MCFGEIPGEEAPTDPGEEVIAAQDKKDARARMFRLIPFAMGLAAVFFVLMGATVYVVAFAPSNNSLEMVDFDEVVFDWDGEGDIEFSQLEEDDPKKGDDDKGGKGTSTKPKIDISKAEIGKVGGLGDPDIDIAGREESDGGTRGTKGGVGTQDVGIKDVGPMGRTTGGGLNLEGVGSPGIQRNSIPNFVLEDDNAIIQMAARVMKNEGRALKACYQQGLKQDETLRGRWVVNFTIKTDGHPKGISVESTGSSSEVMEQCMVKKIEKWQFQKIYKELPVRKSFRFQPG